MADHQQVTKPVYVKSFGCPANIADGEVMAGCLSKAGFTIEKNAQNAEILIYNTCAVKSPTEDRMIAILQKVPRNKRLIVAGCLPLINLDRLKNQVKFDGILGPASASQVVNAARKVDRGEKVVFLEKNAKPRLDLPKIPTRNIVGTIPINYGCLGVCSYCCVLLARGPLRSYAISEIVERVRHDLLSGAREIWLTSQDTACYGRDIQTNLPNLLGRVCKIKGKFYIRIGMMTPNQTFGILDDLIEVYKDGKIFKFLHLPVQSGDNGILTLMNRFYTVEEFKRIVSCFRKELPQITLATDVICGFPGESQTAFERTIDLIKKIQPDIVNISKFFPRPNTPAKKMQSLPSGIVKQRSKIMADLSKSISFEKNKAWAEWKGTILIDEKGKNGSWIGRNFAYKPIVVKSKKLLPGSFAEVQVVSVHPTYLEARII